MIYDTGFARSVQPCTCCDWYVDQTDRRDIGKVDGWGQMTRVRTVRFDLCCKCTGGARPMLLNKPVTAALLWNLTSAFYRRQRLTCVFTKELAWQEFLNIQGHVHLANQSFTYHKMHSGSPCDFCCHHCLFSMETIALFQRSVTHGAALQTQESGRDTQRSSTDSAKTYCARRGSSEERERLTDFSLHANKNPH